MLVRNVVVENADPLLITNIGASAVGLVTENANHLRGKISVVNTGGTTATITETYSMPYMDLLPMRAPHEDSRGTKRSISLLPGQATDIAIPENARQLTSEEILDVGRGRSFYLMGWIVYSDAMDNKRTLAFCRKWDRQSKRFYVVEDPDYEHAD